MSNKDLPGVEYFNY